MRFPPILQTQSLAPNISGPYVVFALSSRPPLVALVSVVALVASLGAIAWAAPTAQVVMDERTLHKHKNLYAM
ncbi:hypothetical protein V8E53_006219 [Lactarius tabidus]